MGHIFLFNFQYTISVFSSSLCWEGLRQDERQRGPVWPAGLTQRSLKEELWDWHGVKDLPTSPKASGMTLCSRGAAKDCRVCVRGERAEPGRRSVLRKSSSRKEMTTKNKLPNAINSPTGERIHACRGVSMIYNIYKRPGGSKDLISCSWSELTCNTRALCYAVELWQDRLFQK